MPSVVLIFKMYVDVYYVQSPTNFLFSLILPPIHLCVPTFYLFLFSLSFQAMSLLKQLFHNITTSSTNARKQMLSELQPYITKQGMVRPIVQFLRIKENTVYKNLGIFKCSSIVSMGYQVHYSWLCIPGLLTQT